MDIRDFDTNVTTNLGELAQLGLQIISKGLYTYSIAKTYKRAPFLIKMDSRGIDTKMLMRSHDELARFAINMSPCDHHKRFTSKIVLA